MRLLLVRVECKVQSEAYCFLYSAQCRVRLLLVCLNCRVQCETVIFECTAHSVE